MAVSSTSRRDSKNSTKATVAQVADPELDSALDNLTIEELGPQKSEHARRVVAAYSENVDQCRELLYMLGLHPGLRDVQ